MCEISSYGSNETEPILLIIWGVNYWWFAFLSHQICFLSYLLMATELTVIMTLVCLQIIFIAFCLYLEILLNGCCAFKKYTYSNLITHFWYKLESEASL